MSVIDKNKFLKRIADKKPMDYGAPVAGEGSPQEEGAEPDDEAKAEGDLTCGEQLLAGIKNGDATAVDNALKEAVAKYGNGG